MSTETPTHRRQRVMGAFIGALVGDALGAPFAGLPPRSYSDRFPRAVLTGAGEMIGGGEWTDTSEALLEVAESLVRTGAPPVPFAGDPVVRAIAGAIADVGDEDPVFVLLREALSGRGISDVELSGAVGIAAGIVRGAASFSGALVTAIDLGGDATIPVLTGALAGAVWGIGAIPARWTTPLHGARSYELVGLRTLAVELARLDPDDSVEDPTWPARGPHLVDPRGLWVADLRGAERSHEVVPGAHVLSLSKVAVDHQQPHWRHFYLVDSEDPTENIALDSVLDEVLTTVAACIDAGEPVIVHCFAGESRTGLVLRAWLMQRDGLTEEEATSAASELWPHVKTWNTAFTDVLRRREGSGTVR
ncbi:MAG TPA: ADP-ribosylglycohydrolase family protein [Acidimicrobiales bacterium]|nr:ADP-ribosylglycohydrolase family protein [Acidimicrobiales bacterium]